MAEERAKQEGRVEEILESEPRIYEVGFHIAPLSGEESIPAEVGNLRSVIEKAGGKIFAEEWPKLIHLAYPMRAKISKEYHMFDTAYFGWAKFDGGPETATTLKGALDGNENVFRFLIVKTVRNAAPRRRFIPPGASRSTAPLAEGVAEPALSKEQIDAEIEKLVVE